MAHFYGSMDGVGKTTRTATGTKNTGLSAHVRGWDLGVYVDLRVDADGKDVIEVYRTGGSNNSTRTHVATIKEGC